MQQERVHLLQRPIWLLVLKLDQLNHGGMISKSLRNTSANLVHQKLASLEKCFSYICFLVLLSGVGYTFWLLIQKISFDYPSSINKLCTLLFSYHLLTVCNRFLQSYNVVIHLPGLDLFISTNDGIIMDSSILLYHGGKFMIDHAHCKWLLHSSFWKYNNSTLDWRNVRSTTST